MARNTTKRVNSDSHVTPGMRGRKPERGAKSDSQVMNEASPGVIRPSLPI